MKTQIPLYRAKKIGLEELRKLVDPNNECCCEHCLSNKCKMWAFHIDCTMIVSSVSEAGMGIASIKDDYGNISICEVCESEPEAIFKATSYIMEQLKQKD